MTQDSSVDEMAANQYFRMKELKFLCDKALSERRRAPDADRV